MTTTAFTRRQKLEQRVAVLDRENTALHERVAWLSTEATLWRLVAGELVRRTGPAKLPADMKVRARVVQDGDGWRVEEEP